MGSRIVALCALLLCLALAPMAPAGVPEIPRLRIVGVAQGLPSSDIKALARDADGYIWMGTADGLARFDGVGVQVWQHDPGKSGSLPGNLVQALHVDKANRVWVAVENAGLVWLDADRQVLRHVRGEQHPVLRSEDVWALASDADGLWIGTFGGGLYRLRMQAGSQQPRIEALAGDGQGLPSDTVLSLAVAADGRIWVATDKGLASFVEGQPARPEPLPGDVPMPLVYSVTLQADGLWVGTSVGVFQRDAGGRWSQPSWSSMFERPRAMTGIASEQDGSRWIISQRGLWRARAGGVPEQVPLGGPGISRAIGTLLLDDNGALWVPVFGAGLGYLRTDWRRLAQFSQHLGGLRGESYFGMAAARDGGVWLAGSNGEVERLDRAGNVHVQGEHLRQRMAGTRLSAALEDASGRLWLGHRTGLLRVDVHGAVTEWHAGSASDPVPRGFISHLRGDRADRLWLVVPGAGVQRRNGDNGKVELDLPAGDASGLGMADIKAMVLDAQEQPWLATSSGVLRFDPRRERFEPVPGLDGEAVNALDFDAAGDLWLQRLSGLSHYRQQGGGWQRMQQVGIDEGLPAVAAAAMAVDHHGQVWLSTTRGLYCWQPQKRLLQRFGVQDGLGSQEFLDRALALAADGTLAAASNDGSVLLVDTDMPLMPARTPTLRIDGAWVRRNANWSAVPVSTGMTLAPGERELRLSARLLAFDDPAANRYWTMLEGYDEQWVPQFGDAQRVYSGLAPGNYRWRVRASDAAGNAAQEQVLAVRVQPAWWATWWARGLLLAALLAALAWVIVQYRQRLRRRHAWALAEQQRQLAEQASQAKTRFLATLGHEVRTPMTGVLGMSELLLDTELDTRQRSHVQSIRSAGEHLLRLVNDALDLSRIEAGKLELNPTDFDLHALIGEVVNLSAPLADRRGLQLAEHIDADIPDALHGDRTRIEQILLNLLGNAIKFTERGHVILEVAALQPQGVRFTVADTGPGLNEEQKQRLFRRFEQADRARTNARYGGSGLGLAISQELAAAMHGRIDVESTPGQGTRFTVALPLPSAHPLLPQPDAPRAKAHGEGLDLLLVEDDPTVAEVLIGMLRAQGHRVVHATHGLMALGEMAARRFDMALLDLDLPGMDGLALARQLRAQGFTAPLLAVTARADADAEPQALAAGFDAFVRKPMTSAMLAEAVEALCPPASGPSTRPA